MQNFCCGRGLLGWKYFAQKKELRAEQYLPPSEVCFRRLFELAYAAVAAAARCFRALATSSPSQRTLTILETPGSCMVTP